MKKQSKLVNKKPGQKSTSQNQMSKEDQQEFLMWLQQKLQIQSEEELQNQIQELGEEGIAQAYSTFQQEKSSMQKQAMKRGGMLKRLANLRELKCGGKMKKTKKESGGKVKKLKLFDKDCCK